VTESKGRFLLLKVWTKEDGKDLVLAVVDVGI
jgi:hypothetical protein